MKSQSGSIKKKQVFEHQQADLAITLKTAKHFNGQKLLTESEEQHQEAQLEQVFEDKKTLSLWSKPIKRRWSWLAKGSLLGIGVIAILETLLSLHSAWLQSPWLFGIYTAVTGVVVLWASSIGLKEWRQLKRLRGTEEAQQVSERLAQSMQVGEADPFIDNILNKLPTEIDINQYKKHLSDEHNDAERVLLFESTVLNQIDVRAKKLVHRYATESALLLAASPIAVLDMAIILWRNQKMIRELARCYGIELGYWSRIKLIRSVITNIIYAGTSEVVTDIGTQLLSLELSGKISTRMAQGLGGGLLTARLGYQTMALCRPVVFSAEARPKLTKIHSALLGELKDFSLSAMSKAAMAGKARQSSSAKATASKESAKTKRDL
ncbi:TIGR01620 family protein [Shewanella sp. Isolate11]|uniref:YcjF family protein n=1 Tax=Shewanella sp. Isolate11 TaxID=2908530 RepID=UPI001EFDDC77|nr:TIGR01620 family protein [Shewanella sp. Isolate11]MCG9696240.1 YcjF family protein [Shewanella sp. Isolate11]